MKVVIAHQYLYGYHIYGGAEKYLYFLGKSLVESGVNIEYVTSNTHGLRELKDCGIKFRFLWPPVKSYYKLAGARESYLSSYKLMKYLEKIDFDVLHATGGAFYLLKNKRRPVVLQLFGMESLEAKGLRMLYYTLVGHYALLKRTIRSADAIAVEDEYQQRTLSNFCNEVGEKTFFLPCGIELAKVDETLGKARSPGKNPSLGKRNLTIISVNRMVKQKGLRYLIDAFSIIKRQIDDAHLVLVGQGPEESKILKRAKALGLSKSVIHYKMLDFETLLQLYAEADIYVSPTLRKDTVGSIQRQRLADYPS
ncbi:MAG: glycosyltransferase family 4 protein [Nitrososphaerales archaeon]